VSGHRPRYTQEQVITALTQAHGLKGPAARALRCARRTVSRYIQRYPAVKAAYEEACDDAIDLAQSKLIALVEKEHWEAIRFLLLTLGRSRGFTLRQEIVAVGDDKEAIHQQFLDDILKVYGDDEEEDDA
jgi:hypothetical protein